MKKILCLILALAMVMSFAACGEKPADSQQNGDAAEGEIVTHGDYSWNTANIGEHKFILAHGLAETSLSGQQYHEFALAVEELSGGKMVVEERVAGTLVADAETLNAVMNGEIDFCHNMSANASGTIADLSPLTVPGYYGGDDIVTDDSVENEESAAGADKNFSEAELKEITKELPYASEKDIIKLMKTDEYMSYSDAMQLDYSRLYKTEYNDTETYVYTASFSAESNITEKFTEDIYEY